MQTWLPIIGYEGLYEVSRDGAVRRLGGTPKCKNTRLLRTWKTGQYQYLAVTLSCDGHHKHHCVAHLVAWAFLGYRKLGLHVDSLQVNHKDGDRNNNCVDNLEYCTALENHQHAALNGLTAKGEQNGAAKLTESVVREIRASTDSAQMLRKRYNVTLDLIYQIRRRQIWKHVA
jgi:hypothetical protein